MANAHETLAWPANHTVVDIACPDEMAFWTKRFAVSQSGLKKVVQLVVPRFNVVARCTHRLHAV